MLMVTADFYEQYALSVFEEIGYTVLHGPSVAPDGEAPVRHGWDDPFLDGVLLDQAIRLNSGIPRPAVVEAIKRLKQHEAIDAVSRNRQVYLWLRNGIKEFGIRDTHR